MLTFIGDQLYMDIKISKYISAYEDKWDEFVLCKSINGTFLQTRRFLNYHPQDRFEDASIIIMNGTNIIGLVPGNRKIEENESTFFSHQGSTFGGIILSPVSYNISYLEAIMPALDDYFRKEGYSKIIMKSTSSLFSSRDMSLLDYEYYRFGYNQYNEIAFYLKCDNIPEDGISMMSSSRRRDYKYSLKNNLRIERLTTDEQIRLFYHILEENLRKFETTPIHTAEELIEFKNKRLSDEVRFYGVYSEDVLVAGSMLFAFGHKVLHTQYLACLPEYNRKFAMNFMDYNLIMIAKQEGYEAFSFGTSTGNHGKDLNIGLALYKEGFGCEYSVNRTYLKDLS